MGIEHAAVFDWCKCREHCVTTAKKSLHFIREWVSYGTPLGLLIDPKDPTHHSVFFILDTTGKRE